MAAGVSEVSLFRAEPLGEWLLPHLGGLLDDSGQRVVLLDATNPPAEPGRLSRLALRDLALFPLPTVFAFEGAVAGGLTEIALAADIRICSEGGSLQGPLTTNSRVSTLTDDGTALALFVGRTAVGASDLLDAGLVSTVTSSGEALLEARRLAQLIASRGPIATRLAKEAVWRGLAQPLDQALRFETDLTLLLQTTKDRAEGVRAFLQKRIPNFTGE